MYEKFYGFKENPFTITPDPKFFFPSQNHTGALDGLIYTIAERRGFAVITGEIGSGKTTICRALLNKLDSGTKVVMITNTLLTSKQLLSSILEDLGIIYNGGTKSNLLFRLKRFLIEQLSLDYNVVLIVDEAQNLGIEVLEEIRMLSNFETEKKKMLQIILTGQPELKDKLGLKELSQLRQRINVQYHISPLNRADTENYINHRLRIASLKPDKEVEFTPEAIDEIYAYSFGTPRLINMVCNNALLIGYVTEAAQITPQIIKEAIEEFQNEIKVDRTIDKPVIKLKAGQSGTNTAVLTTSASGGEIKIGSIGNDDSLSPVYSGIRIFHRNGDIGNYKNFIFSAKGGKKRDYSTIFRIELSNGKMQAGKHHSVRVTDSWQKFNIPLEDFSKITNLNIITEIAFFPDALIEPDDITYIKDICYSDK